MSSLYFLLCFSHSRFVVRFFRRSSEAKMCVRTKVSILHGPNRAFSVCTHIQQSRPSLIWTASLAAHSPVTAAYSKFQVSAEFEKNGLFIKINTIIAAVWAVMFIIQAAISVLTPADPQYRIIWMVGSYIFLIPAFVFSSRFPK
jgi:hypothetical protein